jgi:hypothetical protein
MDQSSQREVRPTIADAVGGASIGALLGLLMGLSTSPVVAGVVAGLVALLGGTFGLTEKLTQGPSRAGMHRLTAFAIAATLITPISVWLRAHDVLGVSLAEHRRTLDSFGIKDPVQRMEWLRYLRDGVAPTMGSSGDKPSTASTTIRPGSTGGLYGYSVQDPFCHEVRSVEVRGQASDADFSQLLANYDLHTKEIQRRIENLPTEVKKHEAYQLTSLFLCGV